MRILDHKTMKVVVLCVFCSFGLLDAAVIRSRRQAFTAVQDPSLNPLTNAVGYDPSLLNSGLLAPAVASTPFQRAGQFQGPASANVQTNSGTQVGGSLNLDGFNLWDGDIFRATDQGNFGTGGATEGTGIDVLGAALANIGTGTSLGDGLLPAQQTGINVPGLTPAAGNSGGLANIGSTLTGGQSGGAAGIGTGTSANVLGTGFNNANTFGGGAGGFGVGETTGANVLGQNVFSNTGGTSLGPGGFNTGNRFQGPGGIDVTSGTSIGNNQDGDFTINDGVQGGDLFQAGTQTTLKNNIPGLTGPSGIQNPYDPYKFKGGYGIGQNEGGQALGTGYQIPQYYGFDWPNSGVTVERNTIIPVLGTTVAELSEQNLNVKPKNSLAEYEFSDYQGFTTLGSGYRDGWKGDAGINGYNFNDRFAVPVLGTKVVDIQDKSGFDLSKFKFDSGLDQQYGPVRLVTNQNSFEIPWLGQMIQGAMWNGALEDAGYAPDDKSVLPPGLIPGVPIVG